MARGVTHGADVEQLDDIAVALRRDGGRIADVGDRGAVMLEKLRAVWDGPDFEKFVSQWRTAHRQIDDAEAAMHVFSRKLAAEAEQQRSSANGARGAAAGSPSHLGGGGGSGAVASAGGAGRLSAEAPVPGASFLAVQPVPPDVETSESGPRAFERLEPGAPVTTAPAQAPTGDGAFVTTAPEAAGQNSVALSPDAAGADGWFIREQPVERSWLRLDPETPAGD